jgi:meiotic recombination protein SPO11
VFFLCEIKLILERNWVIARLETMLEGIVDGLLVGDDDLSITLKSRAGVTRRGKNIEKEKRSIPPAKTRKVNFPGANAQEAWRFSLPPVPITLASLTEAAVLLRVLEIAHECLVDDVVLTKR